MTTAISQNPAALYPEDLFDLSAQYKPWWVAHVKSRREKSLASYLADADIGYYLPMYQRRQPNSKRVRYSLMPLFNGYLFFRGDDVDRHYALRSNQIARMIDVRDQDRFSNELQSIRRVLANELPVYPYHYIVEGKRVRVKKGPLKDVEGVVERKAKNYRLVISVETINQSMAVTIDADMVEPVR
mgnify:CR=1 FL=1